jgi:acyl dehydratase
MTVTDRRSATRTWASVEEGEELPVVQEAMTTSKIVAGAIASRDFMPVHHDRDFAKAQGSPDIFLNILTSNGYVGRYITDWAGPEAMLKRIAIRLGVPMYPGHTMRMTGNVTKKWRADDEGLVEVSMRAANELGDHITGTVVVSFPDEGSNA